MGSVKISGADTIPLEVWEAGSRLSGYRTRLGSERRISKPFIRVTRAYVRLAENEHELYRRHKDRV